MDRRSENRLQDCDFRNQWIAEAAYYLAKTRNFAPGGELDDWLYAENAFDQTMRKRHTLHKFDTELLLLHGFSVQMAGVVLNQLRQLLQVFDEGSAEQANLVIATDQTIDDCQIQLDKQVEQILCLEHPVADDLRTVLSTARIGYELKSIGNELDEAVQLVAGLWNTESHVSNPEIFKGIMELGKRLEEMLDHLIDALKNRDYVDIETLRQYLKEFQTITPIGIALMIKDPVNISGTIDILRTMKNLEASAERSMYIAKYLNEMSNRLD